MRPEDLLNKLFLFKGGSVRAEDVEFEGKTFEKGEKIYSTVHENKGIGVLISGKAVSLRVDGSRIRTLEKGDVYGAEMFFSGDKGFNATFVAYTKCIAAFLHPMLFFPQISGQQKPELIISFISQMMAQTHNRRHTDITFLGQICRIIVHYVLWLF